jgi:phosphoribosylanthranilate isomerase
MQAMPAPFIKICCISSVDEAQLALAHGVSGIGLVSEMPSGPGVIADSLIARIVESLPKSAVTFLLTSRQTAAGIAQQHRFCRTTTVQLVDDVPVNELRALRSLLPDIRLVQVVHVTGESSVNQALAVGPLVDALLLDSGNPALRVKALGGTGRTHDWTLSHRICRASVVPVLLAGGLNPANVTDALRQVGPFGVDVCSGVRTDGRLDPDKLRKFVAATKTISTS